jgi:hypothetical protein
MYHVMGGIRIDSINEEGKVLNVDLKLIEEDCWMFLLWILLQDCFKF